MTNILKLTTQFRKDIKRYKHKKEILKKLEVILNKLAKERKFQMKIIHICYLEVIADTWSVMLEQILF